jgi:hypothetical protein
VAGSRGLSTGLKIGLVHSCLNIKLDQQASDLMLNLMNDTESGVSMDDAVQVFEKAGRHDLAQGMGEQIKIQVDELIAHADEQRTQGDLRAAVDTLNAGLRKAPGNMALLPAAASAMLKQLDDLGWEAPLAEQCQFLLERMRRLDPITRRWKRCWRSTSTPSANTVFRWWPEFSRGCRPDSPWP